MAERFGEIFDPAPRAVEQKESVLPIGCREWFGVYIEANVSVEWTGGDCRSGPGEAKSGSSSERKDGALGPTFLGVNHDDGFGNGK